MDNSEFYGSFNRKSKMKVGSFTVSDLVSKDPLVWHSDIVLSPPIHTSKDATQW